MPGPSMAAAGSATPIAHHGHAEVPNQRWATAGPESATAAPRTSSDPAPGRTLLVDPDRAALSSMAAELESRGLGEVISAICAEDALSSANSATPGNLALVSLRLGAGAPELIATLRDVGWQRVVALFSGGDADLALVAIDAGATGIMTTQHAHSGARDPSSSRARELSDRELEVVRMVADGRSNKWIGQQLGLSALTVKSHLARIGRKLETGDRAHIVMRALRAGVIS